MSFRPDLRHPVNAGDVLVFVTGAARGRGASILDRYVLVET